jgi:hypothetical protein
VEIFTRSGRQTLDGLAIADAIQSEIRDEKQNIVVYCHLGHARGLAELLDTSKNMPWN